MKKQLLKLNKPKSFFYSIFLLLLFTNLGYGQQVIGAYPNMNGGFEGPDAGLTFANTTITTTATTTWTKNSNTAVTVTKETTTPRTGVNYVKMVQTGTNQRKIQSPTSVMRTEDLNKFFRIQFYYKGDLDGTPTGSNLQASAFVAPGNKNSTTLTGENKTGWSLYEGIINFANAANDFLYATINVNNTGTFEFDDFAIYPVSANTDLADGIAPSTANTAAASDLLSYAQTISWTADSGGVDGGGYVVVRGTTAPASPDTRTNPNVKGIYSLGNTLAIGETVVYIGTATSFTDTGLGLTNSVLAASTPYYYRIYSVDKAFNYSAPLTFESSTTAASSAAAEPTSQASGLTFANVTTTSFDINWSAGNGTNSLVIIKAGSAVSTDPSDSVSYTANTAYASGQLIGDGYLVYNGTGTSVSVTGLSVNTAYHVKVFSFNGSGGTENYLTTTPATNNQLTARKNIQSFQTGDWGTATTWVDNVAPGLDDNVTIAEGHSVNVNSSKSCYNITINAGGSLVSPAGSDKTLTVYGTSFTCNGSFGNSESGVPAVDNVSANLLLDYAGSNLTINGSGSIYPYSMRPVSTTVTTTPATVTFAANVTFTKTAGSLRTYGTADIPVTYTFNAGKTVTLRGNFSNTSNGQAPALSNVIINVYGTLNIGGNLQSTASTGKTFTLNVESGGIINATKINVSPTLTGTITSYVPGTLNVASGGTINLVSSITSDGNTITGGTLDASNPTYPNGITGAGTFTVGADCTVQIANANGLNTTDGPIRTTTRTFSPSANYTYIGTSAQVTGADLPTTVKNFNVTNTLGLTLTNPVTVNGNLTLTSGVLTNTTNNVTLGSLTVDSVVSPATIIRKDGSLASAPTFGSLVNVTYNGTGAQTPGHEMPADGSVLNDLTIAGTASLSLSANKTVNNNLNVSGSGSLTQTLGNLTIKNNLINSSTLTTPSVVFENNTNLIQGSATTLNANTGAITVKRNSASIQLYDYTLWSSPVASQELQAFSPNTLATRFYTYNSTTDFYNAVSSTTNFATATGYLIRAPNTWTAATPYTFNGVFTGVPNNGNISLSASALASDKFYAVGNPYPSTISADLFLNGNTTGGTLYFWRKTNNATSTATTSYATYTLAGGSGTAANSNGGSSIIPNGTIQVGQGFIVKTGLSATELNFTNAMRTANTDDQFLRTTNEKSRFWLNLTSTNGAFCQAMVAYMPEATSGVDNAIDGPYFNDSPIALTSIINDEEYTIQGRALPFATTDTVPLGFKTNAAGNYNIAIDHVDGFFSTGQTVFLKDNLLNTVVDLSAGSYSFASANGTFNSRFEVVYQSTLGANNPTFTANSVIVFGENGEIKINSGTTIMELVRVYDLQGRLLVEKKQINASETKLSTTATNQVLLVEITAVNGSKITKKIIQ